MSMGKSDAGSATRRAQTVAVVEECCPAVLSAPLSEQRASELAADLAAVADPVRLRILSMLLSAESGEVCVCEMVEPIGRSQPTISHHLKILADAGLIVGHKRGRWVWYRTVPDKIAHLGAVLA